MALKNPRSLFWAFHFLTLIGLGVFFSESVCAQKAEFTLEIVDDETHRPIPCRVSIRNEKGIPRKADGVPFWYDHFVIPGKIWLEWPLGTYPMTIERGFEYLPRTGHFVLNRYGKDAKTETLKRFTDLSKKGWWSGDLMVMRDLADIQLLMMADDLHFVPLAGSAEKRIFAKEKKAESQRRTEERERSGRKDPDGLSTSGRSDREMKRGEPSAKTDEVWFDSDRLFTTQNYILRHPACEVGILDLPVPLPFERLKLESRRSAVPMLYAIHQKYPDVWIDVQNAESWDLPLMISLGIADSFQLLGPHILRDQLLPENILWKRLPAVKPIGGIQAERYVEKEETRRRAGDVPDDESSASVISEDDAVEAELRADLFLRPSQCGFIPDAAPMNYRGERGRQQWTEEVYFHLLNTGHRIPPSAGSGSGMSPNALGANRMYVFVDPDEYAANADRTGFQYEGANAGFDRKMWWDALKAGRCVVTNGPLLQPWVEGYVPGEVFSFPGGEGELDRLNPSMTLTLQQKAQYIEVIMNGRTILSVPFRNYAETGRLPLLELKESGWFLIRVRVDDPKTYGCVMSAPYYVEVAGRQKVMRKSALFFLNWQKKRMELLEKRGAFADKEGQKLRKLHEFALAYWEQILKKSED
ncbi:MAG: hypothetical protein E7029_00320 [Planctomycetaceae bacterium]|nr:hypothetical protein [Planctomycetaceae bacterium]